MLLLLFSIVISFSTIHVASRDRQDRTSRFTNVEDNQVTSAVGLAVRGIDVLAFDSAPAHLADVRLGREDFFGFLYRNAVFLRQLFNELVFPNDLADDHRGESYHRRCRKTQRMLPVGSYTAYKLFHDTQRGWDATPHCKAARAAELSPLSPAARRKQIRYFAYLPISCPCAITWPSIAFIN